MDAHTQEHWTTSTWHLVTSYVQPFFKQLALAIARAWSNFKRRLDPAESVAKYLPCQQMGLDLD